MTPDHRDKPRTRDGRGRYIRDVDTAQRDAQAAALRADGHTYAAIAEKLGFNNRERARRAVQRTLDATVRESAEELRGLEVARLDQMSVQAWRVLRAEHPLVQRGEGVRHPGTGEILQDAGPVLAAIDRLIRISERRSKLLGLDAPTQTRILTVSEVDAEIERLSRELGIKPGGD